MKHCLLLLASLVSFGISPPASAQYMWMDVNADGICSSYDVLTPAVTSIDIWLSTNTNRNGSPAVCPSGEALTINSYTFVLSSGIGGVTYGAWTDNMGFGIAAGGPVSNALDYFIGRAGADILPPGTYKLGSLAVTVSSYARGLAIMQSTTSDPTSQTSFGSQCQGQDFNNTMRYGENVDHVPPGDWNDVCGTSWLNAVSETTWGQIKKQYAGR